MKIFEMIGKYHYDQVANNPSYRKALDPTVPAWGESEVNKFKEFLKNLDDMNEDNNKGTND